MASLCISDETTSHSTAQARLREILGAVTANARAALTGEEPDHDELSVRILESARSLFARFGPGRTTIDDVARAADVSRITVYRRFSTKDELIEAVVRGEFQRYFDRFQLDIAECTTVADRVAVGFASSLLYIRKNDLIRAIMTAEPGEFISSILGDRGTTQTVVRTYVANRLREEQTANNLPANVDADLVAEVMVRLTTSFLLTPSALIDLDDAESLKNVARIALVPLLQLPEQQRPRRASRSPSAS